MSLYVDVFIGKPVEGRFPPSPNPCVLTLQTDGIRFRNLSETTVDIRLAGVPGFGDASVSGLTHKSVWVAAARPAAGEAGIYDYSIIQSGGSAVREASPRVILDV